MSRAIKYVKFRNFNSPTASSFRILKVTRSTAVGPWELFAGVEDAEQNPVASRSVGIGKEGKGGF